MMAGKRQKNLVSALAPLRERRQLALGVGNGALLDDLDDSLVTLEFGSVEGAHVGREVTPAVSIKKRSERGGLRVDKDESAEFERRGQLGAGTLTRNEGINAPRTSLNRTCGLIDDIALKGSGVVGEVDGDGSVDALGDVARMSRVDLCYGCSADNHLAREGLKIDADRRREFKLGADGEGGCAAYIGDGERLIGDKTEIRSLVRSGQLAR